MEIKRKQKTLAGLFLKYVVLFCVNTFLIVGGCTLLLMGCAYWGLVLPANYAETQLAENAPEIQREREDPGKWIPEGCTYGKYRADGKWLYGSFSEEERKKAWSQYEKDNIYASRGKYYRFIRQDTGDICIVKYDLYMKYSRKAWNDILPAPEAVSLILDAVLFILNAVFLSRGFAKRLNRQLGKLRVITEKIAENDLTFETKPSDIREIDEVILSLSHMKQALGDSLKAQWDMEQQKQEQLAALTHDIKTPLTIIRGNAELMAEDDLSAENRECMNDILTNAGEIEYYLEHMKQVLYGMETENDWGAVSCIQMGEMLQKTAMQLAAAQKMPASFDMELPDGEICCSQACMLRAWNNILGNAAEHTDREKGIEVKICRRVREKQEYLVALVHDYGKGFDKKDLLYADKAFYSGDRSRHDRSHQGLGLAIAKRFMEEQGGFLEYQNHAVEGAQAALWIKIHETEMQEQPEEVRQKE